MDERSKKKRTKKPDENEGPSTRRNPSQDTKKPRAQQESSGEQRSRRTTQGDEAERPRQAKPRSTSQNLVRTQSVTAVKKSIVPPPTPVPQPAPKVQPQAAPPQKPQPTPTPVPPPAPKIQPQAPPPQKPQPTLIQPTPEGDFSKPKPSSKRLPATLTGFNELQKGTAFLIALLWLPRFFIPWMTAWHDFNLFILSNPYHWKARQGELDKHELYAFGGSCLVAVVTAMMYETLQKKFDLKYYLFMLLLLLFTLTPVFGGFADVLLRAAFLDDPLYYDWWFSGVVVMRWVMGSSFAMFPIQFACIYAQNNNMSRKAHYLWTSIFVFFETVNAYVAFWVIPPKCPTREWVQIVVWVGIGIMLFTVTMMCLIFFFAIPTLKYVMLKCITYCRKKKKVGFHPPPEPEPFLSKPEFTAKKLFLCSMICVPVVYSYFSFAVLERFVPDEDWDKHYLWSATSMFYMGRMIGVVVMVLVMFVMRGVFKNRRNVTAWRAEMFYMGVPHVFSILAFLTLVGRFANLSHLKEGDVIRGPIPDSEKTVLLVFNTMFRNRTVCISSEYFRPVKIRPLSFVTRELYDIGVNNFTVNVTVDPCVDTRLQSQFVVDNFTKGDWVVFTLALPPTNLTNDYVFDYYSRLAPVRLLHVERIRPKGVPQIVVFAIRRCNPPSEWFYQFNHTSLPPLEFMANNTFDPFVNATIDEFRDPRNPLIFDVPATGKWKPDLINLGLNRSPEFIAWAANATYLRNKEEFEVRNFTVNYLLEYYYHEAYAYGLGTEHMTAARASAERDIYQGQSTKHPKPPKQQFIGDPEGFKLFTVAEIAGSNSERLPEKLELQQDWAIKIGLTLAGMAAGGLFQGIVYLFWLDPPVPAYRTTTLAVVWVLMGAAAEIPKIKLVDVVSGSVSVVLLSAHVAASAVHFTGAYFMYTPALNSRNRLD